MNSIPENSRTTEAQPPLALATGSPSDAERMDFLNSLVGRHVMTPCWKSKERPDGMRRDECRSDAHAGYDYVSIYIRDETGRAIIGAHGKEWREAIDNAMRKFSPANVASETRGANDQSAGPA